MSRIGSKLGTDMAVEQRVDQEEPAIKQVERASLPVSSIPPLEPQFSHYRRQLPHWRLTSATYFVTWRLYSGQPDLSVTERDMVLSAMKQFNDARYNLFAWVVMNDHVHALVKPKDSQRLQSILHSWKSFTANQLQIQFGRVGRIWQEESFDRLIRNEEEFWQKANYILENPRRRWPEMSDYAWVGILMR